jgi:hypothetical protein
MQYHKTFEWFSVRQRKSVKTNISHDAMWGIIQKYKASVVKMQVLLEVWK